MNIGYIKNQAGHLQKRAVYVFIAICLVLLKTSTLLADNADPADQSTWKVTPNDYAYDMTLTTVLYFSAEETTDPNDRIAAFNGNDCRGVENTSTVINDRYLAYLRIYGNNSSGDTITLYIYDASADTVVQVHKKLVFVPQANYGTQNSPYKSTVTFDVAFHVMSEGTPIQNAEVALNGYGSQISDASGNAIFKHVTPSESISYNVAATGYEESPGTITVDDRDVTKSVELELESYSITIEASNGTIPLQGMTIDVDGYGLHTTNVFGKIHITNVLPEMGIDYNISGDDYISKSGVVHIIDASVYKKVVMAPVTFALDFNVYDFRGPVANADITSIIRVDKTEDFTTTSIPPAYSSGGNAPWQITSDTVFLGNYAIKSGNIADNQQSVISLSETFADGFVSFYSKVSSETGNDKLLFKIDGVIKGSWDGEQPWAFHKYPVASGNHLLEWAYVKDGSTVMGGDCAWLDYINYTSADSTIKTATTDAAGKALLTGFLPHKKIRVKAYSDNHEAYDTCLNSLTANKTLNIELTPVYNLNFKVTSKNHLFEYDVKDAVIWLDEHNRTAFTDSEGEAAFSRMSTGKVPYTITTDKHETYKDTAIITNTDVTDSVELILIEYETYNLGFEIIDGEVPVENAIVSIEGYAEQQTNVFGRATFNNVLAHVDMEYTISKQEYYTQTGIISGLTSETSNKYIFQGKRYNLSFKAEDALGPVEGLTISCAVNAEEEAEDFIVIGKIPENFTTLGNGNWNVIDDTTFQGEYCARSAKIYDNQESILQLDVTTREGYIGFYLMVSSEKDNDMLIFEVDGEEITRWSGEVSWQHYQYKIPKGDHLIKWIFRKDGSNSSGQDCAWIDYVTYPSSDSIVKEMTTDVNGEAKVYDIKPYHLIEISGSSEMHEIIHQQVPSIHSDTTISLNLSRVYSVRFNVLSDEASGNIAIEGAEITLDSAFYKNTDVNGEAVFERVSMGSIPYTIAAQGYENSTGIVTIENSDVVVNVNLTLNPDEFRATDVITPNGDGYNDYWEIYNESNYNSFTIEIFSSEGNKVFSATDYKNNKWDGTANGTKLPNGIYYYLVSNPSGNMVFKGIINLIN
jgi:gliding motility-associated-like protein